MNRLLVICGPTATGKTKLALALAKEFNGELVSADSRQVYKGMDIGTGKDVKNVWLYDIVNPDEEFSVSHYVLHATKIIGNLHSRAKLPILVGGTGLYIKAIVEGIETIHIPRDDMVRKELEIKSKAELQKILKNKSAEIYERMNNSDRNNPRRLIRKIEILNYQSAANFNPLPVYNTLIIGLKEKQDTLLKKIQERVIQRVEKGIIHEIKGLLEKGYSWDLPSMNTFGYKEWKRYIEHPSYEHKLQAIEEWTNDEIGYVKKQMIWFRKQKDINWFDIGQSTAIEQIRHKVRLWYN